MSAMIGPDFLLPLWQAHREAIGRLRGRNPRLHLDLRPRAALGPQCDEFFGESVHVPEHTACRMGVNRTNPYAWDSAGKISRSCTYTYHHPLFTRIATRIWFSAFPISVVLHSTTLHFKLHSSAFTSNRHRAFAAPFLAQFQFTSHELVMFT